jgi:hypothetical protein
MDDVVGDDDGGERSVGECGCSDGEALEVAWQSSAWKIAPPIMANEKKNFLTILGKRIKG